MNINYYPVPTIKWQPQGTLRQAVIFWLLQRKSPLMGLHACSVIFSCVLEKTGRWRGWGNWPDSKVSSLGEQHHCSKNHLYVGKWRQCVWTQKWKGTRAESLPRVYEYFLQVGQRPEGFGWAVGQVGRKGSCFLKTPGVAARKRGSSLQCDPRVSQCRD